MKLNQFNNSNEKEIYIHGINEEVKEILRALGHPTKIAKQLGIKYTKLKEWPAGRGPISLFELKSLLNLCSKELQESIISRIELKETRVSCKYSPHKIKIPNTISEDLSYILGIILGDGSVAGNIPNSRGNWTIVVFFDNKEHQAIYDDLIQKELGIIPKHAQRKPNCFESKFASKIIHNFFVKEIGMHNGKKAHKICFPKSILIANEQIKAALIQGLFDSDGTITKGNIRYSTVSKLMASEVEQELSKMGIKTSTNRWLKDPKYLPLYTISVKSKECKRIFAEKIGFRHPLKKLALTNFLYSPFV